MTRTRRRGWSPRFVSGFRSLKSIPPDLAALGWHVAPGGVRASRGSAIWSPDSASIEHGFTYDCKGRTAIAWTAHLGSPRRTLREALADPVEAMRALEAALARGPLAEVWEEQNGAPQRAGWTAVVRRGRHLWHRLGCGLRPMTVIQEPPRAEPCYQLRFRAAFDGHFIPGPEDGAFHGPIDAMEALEAENERQLARAIEETFAE
ncbi:MAG: hypothetical protein ACREFP_23690 [Acetobacteraceae bacterium]